MSGYYKEVGMGLYFDSSVVCCECKNRKDWDTGFYNYNKDIPDLGWLEANKPRIQCGKCGSERIRGGASMFCSVDYSQDSSEWDYEPQNEDLLWILPIEKPTFRIIDRDAEEKEFYRPYPFRIPLDVSGPYGDEAEEFIEYEGLETRFQGFYLVMHRCDEDERGGYVYMYGTVKRDVKADVEENMESYRRLHLWHTGKAWQEPEGYFREFDFRTDGERRYAALKEAHEASTASWFDCRQRGYPVKYSDVLFDEPPAELVGKYLIVCDVHFYKGKERGNAVAAFTPEEYAVISDLDALEDDYKVWHCPASAG
jgi:hypothetical protein